MNSSEIIYKYYKKEIREEKKPVRNGGRRQKTAVGTRNNIEIILYCQHT